jgi:hypothetical protein
LWHIEQKKKNKVHLIYNQKEKSSKWRINESIRDRLEYVDKSIEQPTKIKSEQTKNENRDCQGKGGGNCNIGAKETYVQNKI